MGKHIVSFWLFLYLFVCYTSWEHFYDIFISFLPLNAVLVTWLPSSDINILECLEEHFKYSGSRDMNSCGHKGFECVVSLQSCLTLCDSMDCSQPGSSVHSILQVRILKSVAMPFSRKSFQSKDWTPSSPTATALQIDSLPLSHQGNTHKGFRSWQFLWRLRVSRGKQNEIFLAQVLKLPFLTKLLPVSNLSDTPQLLLIFNIG